MLSFWTDPRIREQKKREFLLQFSNKNLNAISQEGYDQRLQQTVAGIETHFQSATIPDNHGQNQLRLLDKERKVLLPLEDVFEEIQKVHLENNHMKTAPLWNKMTNIHPRGNVTTPMVAHILTMCTCQKKNAQQIAKSSRLDEQQSQSPPTAALGKLDSYADYRMRQQQLKKQAATHSMAAPSPILSSNSKQMEKGKPNHWMPIFTSTPVQSSSQQRPGTAPPIPLNLDVDASKQQSSSTSTSASHPVSAVNAAPSMPQMVKDYVRSEDLADSFINMMNDSNATIGGEYGRILNKSIQNKEEQSNGMTSGGQNVEAFAHPNPVNNKPKTGNNDGVEKRISVVQRTSAVLEANSQASHQARTHRPSADASTQPMRFNNSINQSEMNQVQGDSIPNLIEKITSNDSDGTTINRVLASCHRMKNQLVTLATNKYAGWSIIESRKTDGGFYFTRQIRNNRDNQWNFPAEWIQKIIEQFPEKKAAIEEEELRLENIRNEPMESDTDTEESLADEEEEQDADHAHSTENKQPDARQQNEQQQEQAIIEQPNEERIGSSASAGTNTNSSSGQNSSPRADADTIVRPFNDTDEIMQWIQPSGPAVDNTENLAEIDAIDCESIDIANYIENFDEHLAEDNANVSAIYDDILQEAEKLDSHPPPVVHPIVDDAPEQQVVDEDEDDSMLDVKNPPPIYNVPMMPIVRVIVPDISRLIGNPNDPDFGKKLIKTERERTRMLKNDFGKQLNSLALEDHNKQGSSKVPNKTKARPKKRETIQPEIIKYNENAHFQPYQASPSLSGRGRASLDSANVTAEDFICVECPKFPLFSTRDQFIRHQMARHKIIQSECEETRAYIKLQPPGHFNCFRFQCEICGMQFSNLDTAALTAAKWQAHRMEKHDEEDPPENVAALIAQKETRIKKEDLDIEEIPPDENPRTKMKKRAEAKTEWRRIVKKEVHIKAEVIELDSPFPPPVAKKVRKVVIDSEDEEDAAHGNIADKDTYVQSSSMQLSRDMPTMYLDKNAGSSKNISIAVNNAKPPAAQAPFRFPFLPRPNVIIVSEEQQQEEEEEAPTPEMTPSSSKKKTGKKLADTATATKRQPKRVQKAKMMEADVKPKRAANRKQQSASDSAFDSLQPSTSAANAGPPIAMPGTSSTPADDTSPSLKCKYCVAKFTRQNALENHMSCAHLAEIVRSFAPQP